MSALETIQALVKAIEAGSYDAAPSTLVQGAALQMEDLTNVMQVVTFEAKSIKLQKDMKVDSCKSTLAQFNRQLSYGGGGGAAQLEGHVGQEETSQFVRITVPMCFYSHTRRVSLASTMVTTADVKKADERAAADAALWLAGHIEHDLFKGKANFSNGGVFDGSPSAIPVLPNMLGVDAQVRMSDSERAAQDLMFAEFGSDESVVIAGGSTLSQENIEDAWTRSQMNHGEADLLYVDPLVNSNYNKLMYDKQRVVLAGSPQEGSGATLRKQWTSGGVVQVEPTRWLSGKTGPAQPRSNGPAIPAGTVGASVAIPGTVTPFLVGQTYRYTVTACNEVGESPRSAVVPVVVILAGDSIQLTIPHAGLANVRYFNVYRSAAGGSAMKFIGSVAAAVGAPQTVFVDLGNKQPGFVTGFLIEKDTMAIKELAPYSRLKLAVTELSQPEAHFRFMTLAVYQPRKNVLIDNLR